MVVYRRLKWANKAKEIPLRQTVTGERALEESVEQQQPQQQRQQKTGPNTCTSLHYCNGSRTNHRYEGLDVSYDPSMDITGRRCFTSLRSIANCFTPPPFRAHCSQGSANSSSRTYIVRCPPHTVHILSDLSSKQSQFYSAYTFCS